MSPRVRRLSSGALALALVVATMAACRAFPLSAPGAIATPREPREQPEQIYSPGNGVTLPTLVKEVRPQYTPAAMQAQLAGRVILTCVVRPNGRVTDIAVEHSLDAAHGLDQQAILAAQQWEFKPGTKDGQPVPVRIAIEFTFTLK